MQTEREKAGVGVYVFVCMSLCDIYMCQIQVEANQYLPTMDLI